MVGGVGGPEPGGPTGHVSPHVSTGGERPDPLGGNGAGGAGPVPGAGVGRLTVYLGAAPGVGKTVAMLTEGHRRRRLGRDVAVGFVECHGRPATEQLLEGLEPIRRKSIEYRGAHFEELDTDAVLERRPQVVLVDELAHTNVPGSGRHEKRWQDVIELADRGIDVITTVNIQHVESLADAVGRMIDVPVRERVPDRVVRRADRIELVDSPPEQLRRRMVDGEIYPPEQVSGALAHYFRLDHLTALRELAQRFLDGETEVELLGFLNRLPTRSTPGSRERVLVGVVAGPATEAVVRRAARMAARYRADLDALFVAPGRGVGRSGDERLVALRRAVADAGAEWHQVRGDDPAQALVDFATRRQVTQIVVGSSSRSRWRELMGGGSVVGRVLRLAGPADIDVHVIARGTLPPEPPAVDGGGDVDGSGHRGADGQRAGTSEPAVEPAVGIEPTT